MRLLTRKKKVERVPTEVEPKSVELALHYADEVERFRHLVSSKHDLIGRVLKSHLIVEYYLNRYLEQHYGLTNLEELRLSYFQKAKLLPQSSSSAARVRPGVLELNAIRNKFSHRIEPAIGSGDVKEIEKLLRWTKTKLGSSPPIDLASAAPIDKIETFATTVAGLLVPLPSESRRGL